MMEAKKKHKGSRCKNWKHSLDNMTETNWRPNLYRVIEIKKETGFPYSHQRQSEYEGLTAPAHQRQE